MGRWSRQELEVAFERYQMVQQWSAVKERISGEKQPDAVEAAAELGFGT